MIEWNAQDARKLRSSGMTWRDIGKRYGVTGLTIHMRLDPVYAAQRREGINERRRAIARATSEIIPVISETPVSKTYRLGAITLPYVSILDSVRPA